MCVCVCAYKIGSRVSAVVALCATANFQCSALRIRPKFDNCN